MTDVVEQTQQLLKDIALMVRPQRQVPWEHVLWDADDVAEYLKVSRRTVTDNYSLRPGFPRALHPGGGYPRWYAHEIVEWVDQSRSRKRKSN